MMRNGSCILIVVIAMTTVLVFTTIVWHSTMYLIDITRQREHAEHHQQQSRNFFFWSIGLCKQNFDYLIERLAEQNLLSWHLACPWLNNEKKLSAAQLALTKIDDTTLELKSKLLHDRHKFSTIKGILSRTFDEKNKKYRYRLADWSCKHTS